MISNTKCVSNQTFSFSDAVNFYIGRRLQDSKTNIEKQNYNESSVSEIDIDRHSLTHIPTKINYCLDESQNFLINDDEVLSYIYSISLNDQNTEIDNAIELRVIILSKEIDEISKIYFEEINNFITMNFVLNTESYNHDLMKKIFNEIELPIRNNLKVDKLIEFNYCFLGQIRKNISKLIFNRECHLKLFT